MATLDSRTEKTTFNSNDIYNMGDSEELENTFFKSKKQKGSTVALGVQANHIAKTPKSSIVDNDIFCGGNSADSNNPIVWLWSMIKSTLKTYFDGLYASAPATNSDAYIPQWNGANSKLLKNGLAVGTSANCLVQLDSSAKLPAIDGSQLTGVVATGLYGNIIIKGLNFTNDVGTPNTILDISAGQVPDDTFAVMMTITAFTKTTGSFAEGTGNGMLNTGSIAANKDYDVYLIAKANGTTDFECILHGVTLSSLPSGFVYKRFVGIFQTDASGYIRAGSWWREGNRQYFRYSASFVVDRTYAALANTNRILVTSYAPKLSIATININAYVTPAGQQYLNYGATAETDAAPSTLDNSKLAVNNSANCGLEVPIIIDSSQQYYVRGSSTNIQLGLKVTQWYYNL